MLKSYAFMRGGCIYTAEPINHKFTQGRLKGFRYRAYCDGQPCGYFATKRDFEAFIQSQPSTYAPGPHPDAAYHAQAMSMWDGMTILAKLTRNQP